MQMKQYSQLPDLRLPVGYDEFLAKPRNALGIRYKVSLLAFLSGFIERCFKTLNDRSAASADPVPCAVNRLLLCNNTGTHY